MPLDEYIPVGDHADDYAENLLMQPCIEAQGFSWDVPWQDVRLAEAPTRNAANRQILNAAIAATYGYRDLGSAGQSDDAWREWAHGSELLEVDDAVFTKCLNKAREVLPLTSGDTLAATGYAQAAYEAAQESKSVKAAAKAWRTCMASAGVSDLPDTPAKMPSEAMAEDFGIHAAPTPTPEEIKVAVRDVACRNSSGWSRVAYNEEWRLQVKELRRNADELQRTREETTEHRATVLKVIAEHAPKAPSDG
ncbi:hypothetical protein ACFOYW_14615 [Gryllotalpicola reticulitermitis]|uniref:Uncharacterized protein n=1 Tax=Gryllotalpicola reticulitermitis TaxID=1184153 RepID=A0ABV8QBB5_9MICO